MAADERPRTTKFYDRTHDQISLDEVEKIGICRGLVRESRAITFP